MYLFQLTEVSPISKKYNKSNKLALGRFNQGMGAPILFGIVFFFIVCLGCANAIKSTVMVVAVFALFVIAVRFKVLRDRIYWPFIALTLYVIMNGVSTFYAVSGKFALREFLKVFLAYLLAVILLASSPKNEETTGKRIATILALCTTVGSIVSIDLISTRWISGFVTWVLGAFTDSYEGLEGLSAGTRITSFFTNSNVFSGFSGLGLLMSLGLAVSSDRTKEKYVFLGMLYANALAFLLAFSMGACAYILLSFIAFLVFADKNKRAVLFLLMVETLLTVAASAAVIYVTSFQAWKSVRLMPLLCLILGAAALCFLAYLTQRFSISQHFAEHKKATLIILCAVLVSAVVYGIAAISITGDAVLAPGSRMPRTARLEPGTYTMDLKAEGEVTVSIASRSKKDALAQDDQVLYYGDAYDATFAVPEDSLLVSFYFYSPGTAHIVSVSCNGHMIPVGYKLLPGFVANRLQFLFANRNELQRLVYFEDGIKLFRRSPLIGLGMGAFENGIKSVQSFYYETKYAHNHYFQTMLETGVVGLILFLVLLLSSAVAVIKSRKKHVYAPALCAALVFMAGQAIHDIVFSSYAYLPIAYGIFALSNLCCGAAIDRPKLVKATRIVMVGIISVCIVVYCSFLAGNMIAKQQADKNRTLQALVQSSKLDKFEWADYALPYVINATGENINPYVLQQADVFADRLKKVDSNTIPIYLAEYYFSTDRMEQGIAMVEKYVDYVASDQRAWQEAFDLLQRYANDSEEFRAGVVRIAQRMGTWNAENRGNIHVNQTAEAFIAECMS